ncbi:MAG: hypothetical protein IKP34_08950 [Bacteroidales bacterium]|nr:hypothetical protein [Bacteroidales bacterium]
MAEKIIFPSVEFEVMVAWIGVNQPQITVPTLGGRSFITVNCPDTKTIHITGSTGRTRDFNETYWRKICRIIDTAERPWMASTYTDKSVPDYYFAPSVPALCKAYSER